MAHTYPILLDVTDRQVVIVGGGAVAVRKARGLLSAGAKRIRCVAPTIDKEMPPEVELICEPFAPRHLAGAELVFAATNSREVNNHVVDESRKLGILVNRADADDGDPGDFSVPAVTRAGRLIVTVSTEGNPALAAKVRDDVAASAERWRKLADAMHTLRARIRDESGLTEEKRRNVFKRMATEEGLSELERLGVDGFYEWAIHGGADEQ